MGFCLKQFCLASSLSLFSCGLLAAERQAIGDWQLQSTLNSIEASTSNGGTSFGLYCQADQCMFYLHDTLMCQPGARSPILMSGVGNAASLSIQCTQIGGVLFQILEPFNTVFDELKKGGLVSFAVPLQNGSFGVSRFSLNGATEAVRRALQEAGKSKQTQPPVLVVPPVIRIEPPTPPVVPGARRLQDIMIWCLGWLTA